ncbi:Protein kinase domain [Trypanosoma melophagium]|uniref:Protein kinase domain n=1 Tax=Trypanosoma melophagium TaxID=715481 RepID=UPI00351A4B51|nr:Protein kinase domain [Trypanosoma melophagium]
MGRPAYDNILNHEIEVMKKVRHRNCVSLLEVINDPNSDSLYLVMEYMAYGSIVHVEEWCLSEKKELQNSELLKTVARNGKLVGCGPLSQPLCTLCFRQLLSGLDYLHRHSVLHHDIKPDNILRGYDNRVCISDFGVSEILKAPRGNDRRNSLTSHFHGGTIFYTAPEVFETSSCDAPDPFLSDVWSLGITLYLMLVGVAPFNGSLYFEIMKEVRDTPLPWNGKDIFGKEPDAGWKTLLDAVC